MEQTKECVIEDIRFYCTDSNDRNPIPEKYFDYPLNVIDFSQFSLHQLVIIRQLVEYAHIIGHEDA